MARKIADSLMEEARDHYDAALNEDMANDAEAEQDLKFLNLDQWTAEDWQARVKTGRPAFVMDRLNQYVNQVTGDMRLNPPGARVRPVDGGADVKTAKVYNGLIRNIEAQSNAQVAYVTAGENAVRSGRGYFRVTYDYVPGALDMELGIGRLASPFAARFYSGTLDPTGADSEGCFVTDLIPKAQYEKRFPKAHLIGWEDNEFWGTWKRGDFVQVAEWWRRVRVTRTLVLTRTGRVIDTTDLDDAEARALIQAGGGMLREREAESYRVEMRLINGVEQLEDTAEWPSQYLPIIRVPGNQLNVGDKIVWRSLIRGVRDGQVLLNVMRSSAAEAAAMAPKAKWLGTTKQFAGHVDKWRNANQLNLPYLPYTPDEKAPGPPQRIAPEMPAAALLQDVALAVQDIEAGVGIYRENLGKETNAQSGRAILSRQREGDVGTSVWHDGLAQGVVQGTRVLVDMIPRVYDTQRTVRILGEDGAEDFVEINATLPDGTKAYDLSAGRYDVVPSVGPSYATKREEARESMMAYFQANPQAAMQMGDIFAKAMDWPGSEEFAARARRIAAMQGLISLDPQNEDDAQLMQEMAQQGQKPDPNMLLAQAEMEKAKAAQIKAETDRLIEIERLKTEQAKLQLEAARLALEEKKIAAGAMTAAADTESKIRERDAKTELATREHVHSVIESALSRHSEQMQQHMANQRQGPVVGLHMGEAADQAMAQGMAKTAENMDRIGQAVEVMAQASQQMAQSVAQSNAEVVGAVREMAAAQNAPRRVVRGPDGRATGVEIVRQ